MCTHTLTHTQVKGYQEMIDELGEWLMDITGFDAISMQPNAGASGEYAGLMAIREYHRCAHMCTSVRVCLECVFTRAHQHLTHTTEEERKRERGESERDEETHVPS